MTHRLFSKGTGRSRELCREQQHTNTLHQAHVARDHKLRACCPVATPLRLLETKVYDIAVSSLDLDLLCRRCIFFTRGTTQRRVSLARLVLWKKLVGLTQPCSSKIPLNESVRTFESFSTLLPETIPDVVARRRESRFDG